jgi:hypothetical protein
MRREAANEYYEIDLFDNLSCRTSPITFLPNYRDEEYDIYTPQSIEIKGLFSPI